MWSKMHSAIGPRHESRRDTNKTFNSFSFFRIFSFSRSSAVGNFGMGSSAKLTLIRLHMMADSNFIQQLPKDDCMSCPRTCEVLIWAENKQKSRDIFRLSFYWTLPNAISKKQWKSIGDQIWSWFRVSVVVKSLSWPSAREASNFTFSHCADHVACRVIQWTMMTRLDTSISFDREKSFNNDVKCDDD